MRAAPYYAGVKGRGLRTDARGHVKINETVLKIC